MLSQRIDELQEQIRCRRIAFGLYSEFIFFEAPGKQSPHSICKPDLTPQADDLEVVPQHAHDFPCWPGTGEDPGPLV